MRLSVAWSLVLCFAAVSAVDAQATFSTAINTVPLYVTVIGGGPLGRRLDAKDFEVRDDGTLRRITQFESGSLPITMALLLDDSPSMRASQRITQAAAAALVQRLKPGDRAAVGLFNRTVWITRDLTGDKDVLLEQVRSSLPLVAGTALWDAVDAGVAMLADEAGHRVVLILSDGNDNISQADATTIASRATREAVTVYGVGIGAEEKSKALKDLALETGGWYFDLKSRDGLSSTFQRVADELRTQYLLGFSPAVLDGRVHRLEVRVKRHGLSARTRRSYVATQSSASP